MKYTRLEIPDLVLCEPKIHEDNRGFVFESFILRLTLLAVLVITSNKLPLL